MVNACLKYFMVGEFSDGKRQNVIQRTGGGSLTLQRRRSLKESWALADEVATKYSRPCPNHCTGDGGLCGRSRWPLSSRRELVAGK
jgi:hypothetical protein